MLDSHEISQRDYIEFLDRARHFYENVIAALLKTLPLKNKILRDLQVLRPNSKTEESSVEALRRLAASIKLFPQADIDELIDEWKLFKSESLPMGSSPEEEDQQDQSDPEISDDDMNDEANHRIDDFWSKVFHLKDNTGCQKYPKITLFMKIALTFSHGNADVERSFSENNLILTSQRTKMSDATLNGYKATSSYMKTYESKPGKLPITTRILKAVSGARSRYMTRIAEERRMRNAQIQQEKEKTESSKSELLNKTREAKANIAEGVNMKKEGMELLKKAIQSKDFNKVSAANALLERSNELVQRGEKRMKEVEESQAKKKKK